MDYDPRLMSDRVGLTVLPIPRVQYENEFDVDAWYDLVWLGVCPTCGRETGRRTSSEGDMFECLIGFGGCHSRFWSDSPDH